MPSSGSRFPYSGNPTFFQLRSQLTQDPTFGYRVSQYATNYPTMSTGVLYSLAAANPPPQVVDKAATADANVGRKKKRRNSGDKVEINLPGYQTWKKMARAGEVVRGMTLKQWDATSEAKKLRAYAAWREKPTYRGTIKAAEGGGGGGVLGAIGGGIAGAAGGAIDATGALSEAADYIPGVAGVKALAEGKGLGEVALTGPLGKGPMEITSRAREAAAVPLDKIGATEPLGKIADVVTPTIRGLAVAANAPYEGLQASFRNTISNFQEGPIQGYKEGFKEGTPEGLKNEILSISEQTVAGQAFRALANGDPVELGSGFLPAQAYITDPKTGQQIPNPEGATVLAAQKEQEKAAPLIGGHVVTPGRWFANLIFEPDTQAFDVMSGMVDAGVAIYGDPANLMLSTSTGLRTQAKNLKITDESELSVEAMRAAGGIKTWRKYFDPLSAKEWMASKAGTKVIKKFTEMTSPSEIKTLAPLLPTVTHDGRVLPDLLAKTTTEAETMNVLNDVLGVGVRQAPTTGGYFFRRNTKSARIFGMTPEDSIDFDNIDETFTTLQRRLQNAKISVDDWTDVDGVTQSGQRTILDTYLSNPEGKGNRYRAIDALMDAERATLIKHNTPRNLAKDMTDIWRKDLETDSLWAVNQSANRDVFVDGMQLEDGSFLNAASTPMNLGELLNSKVELPSYRNIRRNTSFWQPILNNPAIAKGSTLLDSYMSIWRKGKLFRPAWGVRVIGEEQLRMSAVGLNSFANHPISSLAWVLGTPESNVARIIESHFGKAGSKVAGAILKFEEVGMQGPLGSRLGGVGQIDIAGTTLLDDDYYLAGMNRFTSILEDKTAKHFSDFFYKVPRSDPNAARGWIENAARLNDGMTRQVLDAPSPAAAKDWFKNSETGSKLRMALAEDPKLEKLATDETWMDAYVDFQYQRVNSEITAEDLRLQDAFRNLKVGDTKLLDRDGRATKEGIEEIQKILDEGAGPQYMKVQKVTVDRDQMIATLRAFDRVFDAGFSMLMSRPSNYLSRSPTFRQYYWQDVGRMMGLADEEARPIILANARKANLPKDVIRELEATPSVVKAGDGRALNLEQFDHVAKAHALDDTKKLLYDLSEKSQFFDVARNIFPFGEAWKEVLTVWAKVLYKNPEALRRAQQGVQGARGAGFFYKDPQTGEEVFGYPAANEILQLLPGGGPAQPEMPFIGTVKGVNILSSGTPGVGPIIQIAASKLIPDTPDWNWAKDIIFPYGEPEDTGQLVGDIAVTLAPIPTPVARGIQALADPEMNRLYGNRVNRAMQYLATTGNYNLDKKRGWTRLYDDAKDLARVQSLWGALFSAFAPSAPIVDWQVKDKHGDFAPTYAVLNDIYENIKPEVEAKGGDFDDVFDEVAKQYGENMFLLLQPMSIPQTGYVPTTDKANEWVRKNPKLRDQEPDIYGLFAPGEGELSLAEYNRQIQTGERKALTPKEYLREGQSLAADHIYKNLKEQADLTSDEDAAWLKEWRAELSKRFPGWKYGENFEPTENDNMILAIQRAVTNPAFKKASPTIVKTARKYLGYRRAALDQAEGRGLLGKDDAELRKWLREWGAELVKRNSDFEPMWSNVFDRELGTD